MPRRWSQAALRAARRPPARCRRRVSLLLPLAIEAARPAHRRADRRQARQLPSAAVRAAARALPPRGAPLASARVGRALRLDRIVFGNLPLSWHGIGTRSPRAAGRAPRTATGWRFRRCRRRFPRAQQGRAQEAQAEGQEAARARAFRASDCAARRRTWTRSSPPSSPRSASAFARWACRTRSKAPRKPSCGLAALAGPRRGAGPRSSCMRSCSASDRRHASGGDRRELLLRHVHRLRCRSGDRPREPGRAPDARGRSASIAAPAGASSTSASARRATRARSATRSRSSSTRRSRSPRAAGSMSRRRGLLGLKRLAKRPRWISSRQALGSGPGGPGG